MGFYTFRQNNSGGVFDCNNDLSVFVIIEADTAEEANDKAASLGIYFDGVRKGWDCDCCGDRWFETDEYEKTPEPKIYGWTPSEYVNRQDTVLWGNTGREIVTHYKSGQKEWF